MRRIYMDFAASTPLAPAVLRAMRRVEGVYGNPSAPHAEGREAREHIEESRSRIARVLAVKADELIFTASGTEANNLAVHSVPAGAHIIASAFEHSSISEPLRELERHGVLVSYVPPDAEGIISPAAVATLVRPETVLVSIALVQGEIGVIQPLKDIARAVKEKNPKILIHTDASQAPLWMDAAPHALGVDLATYDAQKIMGPKGVGLLWRHGMTDLTPVIRGGNQERNVRPGTENVVGIVGMAEAVVHATEKRKARAEKVSLVRDHFIALLKREIPQAELNGGVKMRIANNVNISVPGADGDYLAVLLDQRGIAVSPRSACVAGGTPSMAVVALDKNEAAARGTIRFTFAPTVTKRDVERAVRALKDALQTALPV